MTTYRKVSLVLLVLSSLVGWCWLASAGWGLFGGCRSAIATERQPPRFESSRIGVEVYTRTGAKSVVSIRDNDTGCEWLAAEHWVERVPTETCQ